MSDSTTISEAKLAANRLNAAKSTGPRTAQGKARSSQNAVTHGIFARDLLVRGEDDQEFRQFKNALLIRLNPRDHLELKLAERIVCLHWRLDRVQGAENDLYVTALVKRWNPSLDERQEKLEDLETDVENAAENLQRARAPHTKRRYRQEHKAAVQALEEAKREFEEFPPDVPAGELLAGMFSGSRKTCAMERLHRYERGLENSLNRYMNQLKELQKKPLEESICGFAEECLAAEGQAADEADSADCDTDLQSVPQGSEDEEPDFAEDSDQPARAGSPCHKDELDEKTNPNGMQVKAEQEDGDVARRSGRGDLG